jgi:hypothetical protein
VTNSPDTKDWTWVLERSCPERGFDSRSFASEQTGRLLRANAAAAVTTLADRFDTVSDELWSRTGYRSDGAHFTIESFARYLVHDPVHHLWDVGKGH